MSAISSNTLNLRRRRRQSGNAMVELALVFLPLFALIFAIVDFSLPIFLRSLLTHAVTEGSRYGITYRTEAGMGHTASIKAVVTRNAAGFLNGAANQSRIEVKYYNPITFAEVTGPNSNVGGNIVEVTIRNYPWAWIAPLWRTNSPLNLTVVSTDRLETLPRNIARPAP
jgi:hypothetical protein